MSSVFTRIIEGQIPAYRIYDDDRVLAFLDISPVRRGHTLVVPKQEVDKVYEIDPALYGHLWATARLIARALEKAIPCKRVGLAVIGLEVPHAHIHLIPMDHVGDLSFTGERVKMTPQELADTASLINRALLGQSPA